MDQLVDVRKATETLQREFEKAFSEKKIRSIVAVSINKSLLKIRTLLAKNVREVFNIDKSYILKGTEIDKAQNRFAGLTGYLLASNKPLGISAFDAKQINNGKLTEFIGKRSGKKKGAWGTRPTPLNESGVFIEVFKGDQQCISSAFLVSANGGQFIAARGSDRKGIFDFMKPRLPIDGITSKSIYTQLINDKVQHANASKMEAIYTRELLKQFTLASITPIKNQ